MKWVFRLATLGILVGALMFPMFIKDKSGKPLMSMPSIGSLQLSMPTVSSDKIPEVSLSPSEQTFYKWQDEKGVWHYSDTKPDDDKSVETVLVNADTNLVQSPPKTEEEAPAAPGGSQYQAPDSSEDALTVERALNLIDDAKKVQGMMEQRNKQLDTIVGVEK